MPYKDPEKKKEYARVYYLANYERLRKKNRERHHANKDEYNLRRKKRYRVNKEWITRRILRQSDPERRQKDKEARKRWYNKNRETILGKAKELWRNNPEFREKRYEQRRNSNKLRLWKRNDYIRNRDTILAKQTPEQNQRWHDLCAERVLERTLERRHRDHALGVVKCKAPKKTDTEFVTPGVPDWIEREMADRERSRKVSAARAEFRKKHRGQVPR